MKNKNRQINRELSQHAYDSSENENVQDTGVDNFEDYADDFAFEKFSRSNGKRKNT